MHKDVIGNQPQWRDVEIAELKQKPWVSICAIDIRDSSGTILSQGTGWLAGNHTVITAAHVVSLVNEREGIRAEVKFPSSGDIITAQDVKRHSRYSANSTEELDLFDIAALRLPSPHSPTLITAQLAGDKSIVEVAGFRLGVSRQFVTHREEAVCSVSIPELLLHRADTMRGHSGAPVVQPMGTEAQEVVGIHIQEDNANPDEARFGRRNVALLLRNELTTFIHHFVSAWN